MLPDPHVKFIVFRRDSATSALDRAEVRVIAKISQAMTFDKAGKPVVTKAEDSNWVIRNISYPYLTAPLKGQRDSTQSGWRGRGKAAGVRSVRPHSEGRIL